jgi:hypothetical protein
LFSIRLNSFPPRYIGTLEGGTYRKRIIPEKHIHHDSQSVAISAALLYASDIGFDRIVIDMPGGRIETSRGYFIARGMPHQFRNFEPQLFLPVSEFGLDKVCAWEQTEAKRLQRDAERQAQLSLFGGAA